MIGYVLTFKIGFTVFSPVALFLGPLFWDITPGGPNSEKVSLCFPCFDGPAGSLVANFRAALLSLHLTGTVAAFWPEGRSGRCSGTEGIFSETSFPTLLVESLVFLFNIIFGLRTADGLAIFGSVIYFSGGFFWDLKLYLFVVIPDTFSSGSLTFLVLSTSCNSSCSACSCASACFSSLDSFNSTSSAMHAFNSSAFLTARATACSCASASASASASAFALATAASFSAFD